MLPYVEKYRPQVLDEVVGNDESIARLKIICKEGNLPNLIFAGPPGIGKTSSILCLAKQMLAGFYRDGVLELNASDVRGIDVVREDIKRFSQKKIKLPTGLHKIVILDEVDNMTPSAQQALGRIMERFFLTTRFALACNRSSKIIEPIQSRCAILRFSLLSEKDIYKRLKEVIQIEKIQVQDEKGIQALLYTAQGDLRNALNNLQSTYIGSGSISEENVFKIVDQPHSAIIEGIIISCIKGESEIEIAIKALRKLWNQGYAASDIIEAFFYVMEKSSLPHNLTEKQKLSFIREISQTQSRLSDGLHSLLQLNGLLCRLSKVMLIKK